MKVVVRPETKRLQRGWSFALSLSLHGSVLAWVALGPLIPKAGPANIYEQEIRPHESHLVWYNLRERLPEIAPSDQPADGRAPRAHTKSPQTLVAGAKDTPRPAQFRFLPAPTLETPKIVPSPNLVALTRPSRPVREFTPAEQPHPKLLVPALPEAPQIAAAQAPQLVPLPPIARPQPRAFTPPVEQRVKSAQPVLAAAPELSVAMSKQAPDVNALLKVQPARRTFVPPVEARRAPVEQPVALPDAPQVAARSVPQAGAVPLPAVARAVRPFHAPDAPRAQPARPADSLAEAPAVSASNRPPEVAMAIVGLFPTRPTEIPTPKTSQEAGFSAGPQPQPGESSSAAIHQLVVPGLLAHAGPPDQQPSLMASLEPPTSPRNLMTAARAVRATALPMALSGSLPVAAPAGSRLTGRVVYSVAIQMPNVTSYSGSWIIWFAEREPLPGTLPDVHPPLALRKVDPKYVASASDEKVEGKVRLAAIIRKNGHVDTVELLQHLDDRLDRSAQEALAKWEFTPALRDGAPVEIDAVFEIPFHLAPRPPK